MATQKLLALTTGDPAGVGPDVTINLAHTPWREHVLVFADPDILRNRAHILNIPLEIVDEDQTNIPEGSLRVRPTTCHNRVTPGEGDPKNGNYIIETLVQATQACLSKQTAGMVTGPVNKGIIQKAGHTFTGHTEWLAQASAEDRIHSVLMTFLTPSFHVGLVTTHVPLQEVTRHVTASRLQTVIDIMLNDMAPALRLTKPRINVCGLNPHAGEGGRLGDEEVRIIEPVIASYKNRGVAINGPFSADSLFAPHHIGDFDIALAMYHDQILPLIKHIHFFNAVNVTFGLPFIRTSVDHGTAYALAGTNNARPDSMEQAVKYATELCHIV